MSKTETVTRVEITLELGKGTQLATQDAHGRRELRPVSLADLVATLQEHAGRTAYLDAGVLATDLRDEVVWWRPPGVQSLALEDAEGERRLLQLPMPGLLLKLRLPKHISMAAFKGKKRPLPDDALFHAPLPNISQAGGVCLGSTEVRSLRRPAVALEAGEVWRDFWASSFTAHDVQGKSRRYPGDVRMLLLELAGKRSFPARELAPMHTSVSRWVGE
jgi:PRTRC genetic system protein B